MKPPLIPLQNYRVSYRDGRVETVEAVSCLRVAGEHVFYTKDSGVVLRVPADSVLEVEPVTYSPRRAMRRKA